MALFLEILGTAPWYRIYFRWAAALEYSSGSAYSYNMGVLTLSALAHLGVKFYLLVLQFVI